MMFLKSFLIIPRHLEVVMKGTLDYITFYGNNHLKSQGFI